MSRPITLAVFLATVAVVVPAAWHAPDADIPTDGPAFRPKQETLHVGDAAITVALDRGVLVSGDRLEVTLVGTAEHARDVALDVRAMQDNGMGAERVENPPTEVGRRRVVVHVAPGGGAPAKLAFKLRPRGDMSGRMKWFDIDVTPAGKHGEVNYYDTDYDPATAAKVGAAVWGGNNLGLVVERPASIPPGNAPVPIQVRVKNTTKHPLDYVSIRIGGPRLSYNAMEGLGFWSDEDGLDVDQVGELSEEPLAPGAERVYTYNVKAKDADATKLPLIVEASATVTISERRNKYQHFGAMATVVVERPHGEPAVPAVAGK